MANRVFDKQKNQNDKTESFLPQSSPLEAESQMQSTNIDDRPGETKDASAEGSHGMLVTVSVSTQSRKDSQVFETPQQLVASQVKFDERQITLPLDVAAASPTLTNVTSSNGLKEKSERESQGPESEPIETLGSEMADGFFVNFLGPVL